MDDQVMEAGAAPENQEPLPDLEEVSNNSNSNNSNETDDSSEDSSRMSPLVRVSTSTSSSRPLALSIPKAGQTPNPNPNGSNQRQSYDWQINKHNLCERGQYLLETGIWSDCTFIVGLPPNVKVSRKSFFSLKLHIFI